MSQEGEERYALPYASICNEVGRKERDHDNNPNPMSTRWIYQVHHCDDCDSSIFRDHLKEMKKKRKELRRPIQLVIEIPLFFAPTPFAR